MRQGPSGVQPLDEHLERHILVIERSQTAGANLSQDLADRRITRQVDPQNQGVDEEADQFVQHRIAASGDRETNRHIRTRAQLGQQGQQRRLDHHETGRIVLTREAGHLLLQLDRPVHRHRRAPLIRHQRVRPVCR